MQQIFHIVKGNHGATYILNVKNWDSIRYSLMFYNTKSMKARFLKPAFQAYLFIKGKMFKHSLKSAQEINLFLQHISNTKTDFNIDDNCSALVAPVQDKVTVNHHNTYFHKFAFGDSYHKVKKEDFIYALFNKSLTHFQVSKYFDIIDKKDDIISFKLSNKIINTQKANLTRDTLVSILIEFFKTVPIKKCSVKTYVGNLKEELHQIPNNIFKNQLQTLDDLILQFGELEFPLGLVHKDFKSWNIIQYKKPLIFDFEETTVEGAPLEDLLNFYIDSIISYKSPKQVTKVMLNAVNLKYYKQYLTILDIEIPVRFFIHIYVIERMVFWHKANKRGTSNRYKQLSDYLIEQKKY